MEIIKNLDLRKMPPFERHEKIFGMLEELRDQEILRITNDHEPKPLFYMLKGEYPGEFDWEYEKEGPNDWIFKIKRISKTDNQREKIKELIKNLHTKEDLKKYKEEAKDAINSMKDAMNRGDTVGESVAETAKEGASIIGQKAKEVKDKVVDKVHEWTSPDNTTGTGREARP